MPPSLKASISAFITIHPTGDNKAIVIAPIKCEAEYKGEAFAIEVPTGFETDFASTPKKLHMLVIFLGLLGVWAAFFFGWMALTAKAAGIALLAVYLLAETVRRLVPPPFGRHAAAAIVHDFLYRHQPYSKWKADIIFWRLMLQNQVPPWRAKMILWAVAIFGWIPWWSVQWRSFWEELD